MSPRSDVRTEEEHGDSKVELSEPQMKPATMSEVTLNDPATSESSPEAALLKPVPISQLFRYADCKDRWLIATGLSAAVLSSALPALVALLFGNVTEAMAGLSLNQTANGSTENVSEAMDQFVFGIIGTAVVQWVTLMVFVFCLCYAAARQTRCIKLRFFRSALRQDISWYDTKEMGNFTTRVTDDLKKIEDGIGEKIGMIVVFFMVFVFGVGLALYSGWKLTLATSSFIPITVIIGAFIGKLQARFAQKEAEAYSKAGAVAEEVIVAIRTVMAFGGEHKEAQRYADSLQDARTAMVRRSAVTGLGVGMVWLTQYVSCSLALWYGTSLVIESRLAGDDLYTAGTLIVVLFAILYGTVNMNQAAPHIESLSTARGVAAAVYSVIERKSEIDAHSPDGAKPDSVTGLLELRDVHFSYPSRPETQVLSGMNLTIRPGQMVALVGSSGCGKSTCTQLIQRFYDPSQGEVLLDGRSISELNVSWLRQQIGVVSQEPVLFSTTIAENIRYGYPDCTMKEIEEAARLANALEFIQDLPHKFDTLVGQKGDQLSGGQKQRIAIARALVRNPRVLLLDEATSALDLSNEAVVQAALDRARSCRTTIVVAHRLSTVRSADLICAMKDGQVVETGSHQQLMEKKGLYYGLVTSQTRDITEEDEDEELEEEEDTGVTELPPVYHPSVAGQQRERTVSSPASESSNRVTYGSEASGDAVISFRHTSAKSRKRRTTLQSMEDEEENAPPVSVWRILKLNRWEWPYLLFGVLAAAVMGASLSTYAVVFGTVLGNLSVEDPSEALDNARLFGLLFLAFGVVALLASFAQGFMFGVAGERLTTRIRKLTFSALLRQEVAYFDNIKHSVGALCARLSGDASSVQGATGTRLGNITQAVFILFLGIGLAFYLSWQLALASLPFVPLCMLGAYIESRQMAEHMAKEKSDQETGNQIAVEAISNIRTVASLGLENIFADQYDKQLRETHRKHIKRAFFRGSCSPLILTYFNLASTCRIALVYGVAQAIPTVSYAAVFAVGKHLVLAGTIPYGNLFIVIECLIYGTVVIGAAVTFSPDMNKAFVAAKRVFALLDRKPASDSSLSAGLKLPKLSGAISLEGVVFRYPTRPGVTVLRDLSLEVQPGQQVALVGASGCGKSTCFQLLERFYDAEHGDVKVDGQNVTALNLSWLRSNIGIVSQEPVLFDTTIRENIAYGDNSRTVSMDEIIEAARDANIHNFIASLPAGYDTQLGSNNSTQLSGGQKQRIAIARALVRRPAVLLLDEATSALDTESEKVVQETLDRAARGRTCLVIAQRLSTIQEADKILVINRGKVLEEGTHQELLSQRGMYYQLYKTMG